MINTGKGFIVLFRAFTTWEWYDDALTVKLFIHLILTVNWEDKKWRGQTIKRGQIITSLSNLAKASNMSVMQVRKRLSDLESTGEITTNRTNRFTLVTVVKYDIYQDKDRITTIKQQSNNNQTTTTKPLKQLNKEIEHLKEAKKVELNDVAEWIKTTSYPERCPKWLFEKLQMWIESDWHDGNGARIKSSWKSKLRGQLGKYAPDKPKRGNVTMFGEKRLT